MASKTFNCPVHGGGGVILARGAARTGRGRNSSRRQALCNLEAFQSHARAAAYNLRHAQGRRAAAALPPTAAARPARPLPARHSLAV
jgi:hypothetical protein